MPSGEKNGLSGKRKSDRFGHNYKRYVWRSRGETFKYKNTVGYHM